MDALDALGVLTSRENVGQQILTASGLTVECTCISCSFKTTVTKELTKCVSLHQIYKDLPLDSE